jgi:hypothetical protein
MSAACHHGGVMGPLALNPPCEQGLTVVGGGCWDAVSSSSLCTWSSSQVAPMIHYKQLLVDMGWVLWGIIVTIGCHWCSASNPPHKQLLMRLGQVMWPLGWCFMLGVGVVHQWCGTKREVGWCLPDGYPPPQVSQCSLLGWVVIVHS